jgi:hypothetical protein
MALVFSAPGKLGDALHQWPVAYQYCTTKDFKCELWLDEASLKPLVSLFEAQPCVSKVKLIPGIKNYSCGGQPYDFAMENDVYMDNEVYHLGLRTFPSRQLTLEAVSQVPLNIDASKIASEPSLTVPDPLPKSDRVILHGNFLSHMSGVPGFWQFLNRVKDDLPAERIFVGTKEERERAKELYPEWDEFDDEGEFLKLAQVMHGASLVIACGSSVAALAGQLKVPCVRVHDPIGEHPKVIWSNLGPNQWNYTEKELRTEWDKIRENLFSHA